MIDRVRPLDCLICRYRATCGYGANARSNIRSGYMIPARLCQAAQERNKATGLMSRKAAKRRR